MTEQLVELQQFEIARAHSVIAQPDGTHLCRCGWVLPDLGFGWNMVAVLDHYRELS